MTRKEFIFQLYEAHRNTKEVPCPKSICSLINGLLQALFPELSDKRYLLMADFEKDFEQIKIGLVNILSNLNIEGDSQKLAETFFDTLPSIRATLIKDAKAMSDGDPAAENSTEVIRTYPGFYAVAIYRIAHELYKLNVPLVPRILTEHAHGETGIDIHPGALIGKDFCIDHGTGIVIGGTTIIGNNVKIYQGVTLGALSVRKELAKIKRHPTIQDNVIIYSGATILGGDTIIGHDSVIGGNVWLTKSVSPHSRIYFKGLGQEARTARQKEKV